MDFFNEKDEVIEEPKRDMLRVVGVEGDEMIVALKMDKPTSENLSKSSKKNHVIHYGRKVMEFTYKGRKVTVRTMILVAAEK